MDTQDRQFDKLEKSPRVEEKFLNLKKKGGGIPNEKGECSKWLQSGNHNFSATIQALISASKMHSTAVIPQKPVFWSG